MPVHKRKYRSGAVVWFYEFNLPGATRHDRTRVSGSGFATKKEAIDAEIARRLEEQQKRELAKTGSVISAPLPTTLSMLLDEFFRQHVHEKLAPKTIERYHEQASYLSQDLLSMCFADITPLHLSREWHRLLEKGGHHRRTKQPRPLSPKTVRNIAGVLSSAFLRAIKWGLTTINPVTNSEPPIPKKRIGLALTPAQQRLLWASATRGPWCLSFFLETTATLGARRGEVLALRWSDLKDGRFEISRSLTQTAEGIVFKGTKTGEPRRVSLPPGTEFPAKLETHHKRQDEFRQQFGTDYRTDLDLIFANPDGTPLKPDSISASVSLLCRRLGFPKGASLHTLRHYLPFRIMSRRRGQALFLRLTSEAAAT
jgi:integrase